MMREAQRGGIDCIVVKDLSRLGRNYVETGDYLERVFPGLGIRFISVDDQYDSAAPGEGALSLDLKNICHHLYAVDVSKKICTLLDVKKKRGLFLGKCAPYGYRKSPQDRYRLEVEEEGAKVVRKIFALRLQGLGPVKTARYLNEHHVPSPAARLHGRESAGNVGWQGSSVADILGNPVYCGCIVERKSERAYYKGGGQRFLPREQWNYIWHTHEAIVDRETYFRAQVPLGSRKGGGG